MSSDQHRWKSYKNKGLDQREMRRRREEEGVQLRKVKRDQQVWCRWQITMIHLVVFREIMIHDNLPIRRFADSGPEWHVEMFTPVI